MSNVHLCRNVLLPLKFQDEGTPFTETATVMYNESKVCFTDLTD